MASTACLCAGLCSALRCATGRVQEPPAESLRCVGESGGPGLALEFPAASFCCKMVSCMHADYNFVAGCLCLAQLGSQHVQGLFACHHMLEPSNLS
jgi:hypothetical protein